MLGNSLQVSLKIFLGLAGRRLAEYVEPAGRFEHEAE